MRICVFCGSNTGRLPAYAEAARELGQTLAERGIGIVYGGASVGLMGVLADAALDAGGEVVGVIPRALMRREIGHQGLSELRVVESMHARKAMMAELSDAFVALPGGAGTLEEIFEMWTWGQLGDHEKPCALLNVAGYYDKLIGFMDHAAAERFMRPEHRAMLLAADGVADLLAQLGAYHAPHVRKWIAPAEA